MSDKRIEELHTTIIQQVHRRLVEESIARLRKCLGELTDEEIWTKPNKSSNSVGNLTLHLCGNARQWLISGLGGVFDDRNRQAEFDEQGPKPSTELFELIDDLESEIETVLGNLKSDIHTKKVKVQGFDENGFAVLMHVVEHFSYHVGQISYYVKLRKDIDLNYYGGQALGITSND